MKNLKADPSGSIAIKFTKMHGLGNDYVFIMLTDNPVIATLSEARLSCLARDISSRHLGVGGDGMVLIAPAEKADWRMRIWNADGSEAQMCGNASRCVGKLIFDRGLASSPIITLDTLAGIKTLNLITTDGQVQAVAVDMGVPVLDAPAIPVIPDNAYTTPATLTADTPAGRMCFTAVSMGNPHGVTFLQESPSDRLVHTVGPAMEHHPSWPEKANIEFAHVLSPSLIEMRVWERGSGETMACGTGSCATAVAAMLRGLTGNEVDIKLPGGTLHISINSDTRRVTMTGTATTVAEGTYYASL